MVKRKQIVAFTAVGGTVGSNVITDTAVLTASAASKITLSAKTFGLATPADSVKLYHGETLISEYSWKEFKEGISLTGANDTYLVLEYDDGTLIKVTPNSDLIDDVNLDGKVNVKDIIMLQKHLMNVQVLESIENFINADMNRDGDVDVIDLALLRRLLTAEKNK